MTAHCAQWPNEINGERERTLHLRVALECSQHACALGMRRPAKDEGPSKALCILTQRKNVVREDNDLVTTDLHMQARSLGTIPRNITCLLRLNVAST